MNAKKFCLVNLMYILSMLKWLLLAVLCGLVIGSVSAGFLHLLNLACDFTEGFDYYFVFLPVVLFLSSLTIKYLAPDAEGHGTEKAIRAIHTSSGRIKLAVIPVKMATTVLTIAGGGSAGKEGPTTQIGAGLSSGLASLLRLNDNDRKKLVVCGMSAAFAAIFGTPIGAAVFAIEVLAVGSIKSQTIFPALISAVVGLFTAKLLKLPFELFAMPEAATLSVSNMAIMVGAGVFFGLVSMLLIYAMKYSELLAKKLRIYKPLKGLIGGAVLVLLALLLGRRYCGMGIDYFMGVSEGNPARLWDFLVKIVFTAITLGWGGSGGILTPIMFIGITAGSAFGQVFHLDLSLMACIGLLAVLASSANTPLAVIIMALELFGPSFAVLAAIACPVAYMITGHKSVYPTQRLVESKTNSVRLTRRGDEIESAFDAEQVVYGRTILWLKKKLGKGKPAPAPMRLSDEQSPRPAPSDAPFSDGGASPETRPAIPPEAAPHIPPHSPSPPEETDSLRGPEEARVSPAPPSAREAPDANRSGKD